MQFNVAYIEPALLIPLRRFFSTLQYGNGILKYDPDPKKTKVVIDSQFNFNREEREFKPRILVNRGTYSINKTGISDNMTEAPSNTEKLAGRKGDSIRTNFVLYQGQASIIIEARNRGVCETLTDMVTHFLVWTRPIILNELGFKEFGMPMQVSDAVHGQEAGVEKHSVSLSLPYIKEELWKVEDHGILMKDLLVEIQEQAFQNPGL